MNSNARGIRLKPSTGARGFSLIEVLIALFILAISLLALAGLMVTTTRDTSFGGHVTEAATFAQDALETLRAAPWGSIVSGADLGTGSTGINYARSWTVTDNPDGTQRWVRININWTDPTKMTSHSVSLMSVVSQ